MRLFPGREPLTCELSAPQPLEEVSSEVFSEIADTMDLARIKPSLEIGRIATRYVRLQVGTHDDVEAVFLNGQRVLGSKAEDLATMRDIVEPVVAAHGITRAFKLYNFRVETIPPLSEEEPTWYVNPTGGLRILSAESFNPRLWAEGRVRFAQSGFKSQQTLRDHAIGEKADSIDWDVSESVRVGLAMTKSYTGQLVQADGLVAYSREHFENRTKEPQERISFNVGFADPDSIADLPSGFGSFLATVGYDPSSTVWRNPYYQDK